MPENTDIEQLVMALNEDPDLVRESTQTLAFTSSQALSHAFTRAAFDAELLDLIQAEAAKDGRNAAEMAPDATETLFLLSVGADVDSEALAEAKLLLSYISIATLHRVQDLQDR
jgi:hypothetical protein